MEIPKYQFSKVNIMRSYDYCHFECELGSNEPLDILQIDEMRKHAALLVDEAVRQYKIARTKDYSRENRENMMRNEIEKLEIAKKKPKSELTPSEAALLRADSDKTFWSTWDQEDYQYFDEEKELHFSTLNKFKEARIKSAVIKT